MTDVERKQQIDKIIMKIREQRPRERFLYSMSTGDKYELSYSNIVYTGSIHSRTHRPHGYGEFTYTYHEGSIDFAGYFNDGIIQGEGRMTFPDGTRWAGVWENGRLVIW